MNLKTVGQISLALLVGGLAVWNFTRSSDGRKLDLNPYKALGTIAAVETSKLVGPSGTVVAIVPDPGDDPDPVMDAQVAAYRNGLKEAGKLTIEAVETVKMDPFLSMRTGGAMPPEQFHEVVKRHPSTSAFVFFIGFPPLDDAEQAKLKSLPAKRIVISASLPGYRELLQSDILHLAIVPRNRSADDRLPAAKSTQEAFDQEYQILRKQ